MLDSLHAKTQQYSASTGKRHQSQQNQHPQRQGVAVKTAKPTGPARNIAVAATLRASAIRRSAAVDSPIHQPQRDIPQGTQIAIGAEDLRVKVRSAPAGTLLLFVVDSSGSMGARKRMALVKGVILDLLRNAYRKRDRIGMIVFRGEDATLLVPPTNSVDVAEQKLRHLPTGGKTPLTAGLVLGNQVLEAQIRRSPGITPLLVLVTDGRGNVGPPSSLSAKALAAKGYPTVVLDSEQGYVRMGDARKLAQLLNATYATLDQIQQLVDALR